MFDIYYYDLKKDKLIYKEFIDLEYSFKDQLYYKYLQSLEKFGYIKELQAICLGW